MPFLQKIAGGLRALFRKHQVEQDLDDELRDYVDAAAAEKRAAGLSREASVRAARLEAGSFERAKEDVRASGWESVVESFWQDVRFGLRMLRKDPGFAAIAVLTLALGIGANTAIFSVVNEALLLSEPYPQADRLVRLWETSKQTGNKGAVSVLDLNDWQSQSPAFEGLAAYRSLASFNLLGVDGPERVPGAYVTANFFDVFNLRPVLGRGFLRGEDTGGREHEVVLSDALWRGMFAGDPKVIGQTLRLNSEAFNIVGVMPSVFRLPYPTAQLWVPLVPTTQEQAARGAHFLQVFGRLKSGVSLAYAQAQMAAVMSRIEQENPQYATGRSVYIEGWKNAAVENVRGSLLILLAAVSLVFLVACANVANLLLSRMEVRQREISIRLAIGASWGRLSRQFLTEALLLSVIGGVFAWILAVGGTALLGKIQPETVPSLAAIRPDVRVLGFLAALSVLAAVSLSLAMIFHTPGDVQDSLKEGSVSSTAGRRQGTARSALVIGQTAAALALMIGAVLLIESLGRLMSIDPGFRPEHVLTMRIALPSAKYSQIYPESRFYEPALDNVNGIPGVQAAGLVSLLPVQSAGSNTDFQIAGRPAAPQSDEPFAEDRGASPDYFRALGIPLVRGRFFSESDDANAPLVLIINEALADKYFSNQDPIGKQALFDLGADRLGVRFTIVGVVGNTRQFGLAEPPHPEVDFCYLQGPSLGPLARQYISQTMSLVVRTDGDPAAVAREVRKAILAVDPDQPVYSVETMDAVIATSVGSRRFDMQLMGAFAVLAMTLAALGIYGVISYNVRQRTHEIGIRLALGAQRGAVLRIVILNGMKLALAGICIGIVGALSLTRFLSSQLFGVKATDPLTYVAVTLLLTFVVLLACYLPARRAMSVDPVVALRHE
jgi:predicted permease